MNQIAVFLLIIVLGCTQTDKPKLLSPVMQTEILPKPDTLTYDDPDATYINTGIVKPGEVVVFAQTLKGVPYQYASCSPESGFDCSGFVYYVFEHFKIKVPRSSRDFTDIGKTIEKEKTKPGDLILFTGTNSKNPEVGHIVLCCQMKTIAWYLFTLLPVRRIV